jgi:hypothetical protein
MLYETTVEHSVSDPAIFSIPNICDRAIVLLDDVSSETVLVIRHFIADSVVVLYTVEATYYNRR